jgi:hypothetical protein
MRPRRPLLRFGVALQAILLLAIQIADGSGVHRCPDHDSGLGVLALGAPQAHHHGGHHDGSGKHEGLCPCLGACHNTTVALAPSGAAVISAAPVFVASPTPVLRPILLTHVPHLLPFALGPPSPVPPDFA